MRCKVPAAGASLLNMIYDDGRVTQRHAVHFKLPLQSTPLAHRLPPPLSLVKDKRWVARHRRQDPHRTLETLQMQLPILILK
jgi:hypothetical protein